MARIDKFIEIARNQRGETAECHAGQALDVMIERGEILSHWQANWHQDRREGVDWNLMTSQGDLIQFQIKSSYGGVLTALQSHPNIPVLMVKPGDTTEIIIQNTKYYILKRRTNFTITDQPS